MGQELPVVGEEERNDIQGVRLPMSLLSNDGDDADDDASSDEDEEVDDEEALEQYLPIAARAFDDSFTLHFRQYGKKSRVPKTDTILPSWSSLSFPQKNGSRRNNNPASMYPTDHMSMA